MKYLKLQEPPDAEVHQILGRRLDNQNILEMRKKIEVQQLEDSFELQLDKALKERKIMIDHVGVKLTQAQIQAEYER